MMLNYEQGSSVHAIFEILGQHGRALDVDFDGNLRESLPEKQYIIAWLIVEAALRSGALRLVDIDTDPFKGSQYYELVEKDFWKFINKMKPELQLELDRAREQRVLNKS